MIKQWFPNPILHTRITNHKEILNNILPYLTELWQQPDSLIPPWIGSCDGKGANLSTFPTNDTMDPGGKYLHLRTEMKTAVDQIMFHVNEYWKSLKVDPTLIPVITDMWCQTYISGTGYRHNHSDYLIAGGLYLEAVGTQQMIFESPIAMLYPSNVLDAFSKETLEIVVDVSPGDLILWPGWMNHTVVARAPENWPNHRGSRISLPFMVNGIRINEENNVVM